MVTKCSLSCKKIKNPKQPNEETEPSQNQTMLGLSPIITIIITRDAGASTGKGSDTVTL